MASYNNPCTTMVLPSGETIHGRYCISEIYECQGNVIIIYSFKPLNGVPTESVDEIVDVDDYGYIGYSDFLVHNIKTLVVGEYVRTGCADMKNVTTIPINKCICMRKEDMKSLPRVSQRL